MNGCTWGEEGERGRCVAAEGGEVGPQGCEQQQQRRAQGAQGQGQYKGHRKAPKATSPHTLKSLGPGAHLHKLEVGRRLDEAGQGANRLTGAGKHNPVEGGRLGVAQQEAGELQKLRVTGPRPAGAGIGAEGAEGRAGGRGRAWMEHGWSRGRTFLVLLRGVGKGPSCSLAPAAPEGGIKHARPIHHLPQLRQQAGSQGAAAVAAVVAGAGGVAPRRLGSGRQLQGGECGS